MAPSDRYAATAERFESAYRTHCARGHWTLAVDTRAKSSLWALGNGEPEHADRLLNEAIGLAEEHDCAVLAMELRIGRWEQKMTGDPTGAALDELNREFPRLVRAMVKLLLSSARKSLSLDDEETAGESLEHAAAIAKALSPADRSRVELELADFHEMKARKAEPGSPQLAGASYETALEHAEQALRSARNSALETLPAPLAKLVLLRAQFTDAAMQRRSDEALDELERGGWVSDYVNARIMRAQRRCELGQFETARADVERALAAAPNVTLRRQAWKNATLVHYGLGERDKALSAAKEAVRSLETEGAETTGGEAAQRERFRETEGLYLAACWIAGELGRAEEAFNFAENGRCQSLRRELALAGTQSAEASGPMRFEDAHAMLSEDSAALLTLGVTRWGTVAVLSDPWHPEPRIFHLQLTGKQLNALLAPGNGAHDEKAWSEALFSAVPALSEGLMPRLEPALQEIEGSCRVLYVSPDSFLYRAPLSALQLGDGSRLIEHIPLAVVPSANVLATLRSRREAGKPRACMAWGMGESNGIYFRSQADDVARLPWESCKVFPERTSKDELLAAMTEYTVVHLACHGSLPAGIADPLAASQLEMFPPQILTAGDILRRGNIGADLVFLNACQSGRFRMGTRTEPDGFWRAFLEAGSHTLIATLALVDPDAAGTLALEFYSNWLCGACKAKALQQAQCAMIRRGAPVEHWAAHIMVGDGA